MEFFIYDSLTETERIVEISVGANDETEGIDLWLDTEIDIESGHVLYEGKYGGTFCEIASLDLELFSQNLIAKFQTFKELILQGKVHEDDINRWVKDYLNHTFNYGVQDILFPGSAWHAYCFFESVHPFTGIPVNQTDWKASEYEEFPNFELYVSEWLLDNTGCIKEIANHCVTNPECLSDSQFISSIYDLGIMYKPSEKREIIRFNKIQERTTIFPKDVIKAIYDYSKEVGRHYNYEYYRVESFKDMAGLSLQKLIDHHSTIKRCENCGKFFIAYTRSDALYCDRKSPQDTTKTCKEFGAIKAYQANLKNDEAMGLYRKIYMSKQMLAKRNPDIAEYIESFERYKQQSKQWKSDVKAGIKTESEYIAWLKEVKERKVL